MNVTYIPNPLIKDKSLIAHTVFRGVVEFEDICEYASKLSGMPEKSLQAAAEHLAIAIQDELIEGNRVKTPFGNFLPSITNTHITNEDTIIPEVLSNNIQIRYQPTSAMLEQIRKKTKISIITNLAKCKPKILQFKNLEMPNDNNVISSGHVFHIQGSYLKFDKKDQECGVFFIDSAGIASRADLYSRNGSAYIDGKIPSLSKGNFKIEVRRKTNNGNIICFPENFDLISV